MEEESGIPTFFVFIGKSQDKPLSKDFSFLFSGKTTGFCDETEFIHEW
jgi:hypothetical protein